MASKVVAQQLPTDTTSPLIASSAQTLVCDALQSSGAISAITNVSAASLSAAQIGLEQVPNVVGSQPWSIAVQGTPSQNLVVVCQSNPAPAPIPITNGALAHAFGVSANGSVGIPTILSQPATQCKPLSYVLGVDYGYAIGVPGGVQVGGAGNAAVVPPPYDGTVPGYPVQVPTTPLSRLTANSLVRLTLTGASAAGAGGVAAHVVAGSIVAGDHFSFAAEAGGVYTWEILYV